MKFNKKKIALFIGVMITGAVGFKVYGDYRLEPQVQSPKDISAERDYSQLPQFFDYAIKENFFGYPAEPKLESDPGAVEFSEEIIAASKSLPNFAGHYTLVRIFCGEDCESIAIVNALDGVVRIWNVRARYGFDFKTDSALVIVDPARPDAPLEMRASDEDLPTYYVWTGSVFKQIYRESR